MAAKALDSHSSARSVQRCLDVLLQSRNIFREQIRRERAKGRSDRLCETRRSRGRAHQERNPAGFRAEGPVNRRLSRFAHRAILRVTDDTHDFHLRTDGLSGAKAKLPAWQGGPIPKAAGKGLIHHYGSSPGGNSRFKLGRSIKAAFQKALSQRIEVLGSDGHHAGVQEIGGRNGFTGGRDRGFHSGTAQQADGGNGRRLHAGEGLHAPAPFLHDSHEALSAFAVRKTAIDSEADYAISRHAGVGVTQILDCCLDGRGAEQERGA
jgi:hypothetical protein